MPHVLHMAKFEECFYDLNISYIFSTSSQCHKMDQVKAINVSGSFNNKHSTNETGHAYQYVLLVN
jgi:hypothetical protein